MDINIHGGYPPRLLNLDKGNLNNKTFIVGLDNLTVSNSINGNDEVLDCIFESIKNTLEKNLGKGVDVTGEFFTPKLYTIIANLVDKTLPDGTPFQKGFIFSQIIEGTSHCIQKILDEVTSHSANALGLLGVLDSLVKVLKEVKDSGAKTQFSQN